MANEIDFLAELSLDLDNIALDGVFTFRLGTQAEALHASTGFIRHRQQVSATANQYSHECQSVSSNLSEKFGPFFLADTRSTH